MDVFSSVKELNTLLKEKNRLLIKRMLDFYLKVTIDKNWHTQNFEVSFWGALTDADIFKLSNVLL